MSGWRGVQVRQLVGTVHPFHDMGFKNHRAVPLGAAPGLKVLEGCARLLLHTIMLEGYASDLEVRVEVGHDCLLLLYLSVDLVVFVSFLPPKSGATIQQV